MTRYVAALIWVFLFGVSAFPKPNLSQPDCAAPELICKASANQDRSLYVRDRCKYEQKIYVERFKLDKGNEKMDEVRETGVIVQPADQPDKSGKTPVEVRVTSDTDKKGNPKGKVDPNDKTLLSFGAVWDLAFFPLLPEKLKNYNFQEVVAERQTEKWYRFAPKPEIVDQPLASGVVMLDSHTGEVLTIKIEGLHNLEVLDKNAGKLRSFYATIDYSQFQGALRIPTLASGGGVSDIPRFGGNFRFKFQEGRYVIVSRIE